MLLILNLIIFNKKKKVILKCYYYNLDFKKKKILKKKKEIENLKKILNDASKPETKVIFQNSNSNNNIIKNIKDYDYMSNLIFNDFIFLLKILNLIKLINKL